MCYAPWVADVDDCVNVAYTTMWLDLSGCQAQNEKGIAEVAMLDKKQAEKVKAIDPEPLLEALQQPKPEEKPPELKPEQPQQPKPPAPPPPPRPSLPMQVVETAKPQDQAKPPEDTRLLSEYDTHVEKQKVAKIVLNMEQVRYFTSSVIGKLIMLHRRMSRSEGQMVLTKLRPEVEEILSTSQLLNYFHTSTPDDGAGRGTMA